MNNRKGLTLIEIIIAMALLGIISVGLLSAMATNFTMVAHSKQMTTDVFAAQRTIEDLIQGPPDLSTVQNVTVTFRNGLGTQYVRQVTGYPLDVEIANGRSLFAFDAEIQMPEPSVPVAETVTLAMRNDSTVVDHVYAVDTRSNLIGNHTIQTTTIPDWLYTQHRWYVSKKTTVKAFNPIIPSGIIPEEHWGIKYPRFPEDYELIAGATTSQLDDLTNYKGRHVVYAVRPVAKTGRIGAEVHSNPVWVIGLPVISGLKVHLDASMISATEGTAIQQWKDLTNTLPSASVNDARQTNPSNQPILKDVRFGKALSFDGINDVLDIANESSINLNQLTVIAVAKSDREYDWFTPIIAKHTTSNAWGLGWTADQSSVAMKKLGFFIRSNAGWPPRAVTDLRQGNEDEGLNDDWHILRGTATASEVGFWIDKVQKERAARAVGSNISSNNAINIGGLSGAFSKMDLAEIIIYNGSLTDAQLTLIEDYLIEKYTAVPVNVISSDATLQNLSLDGTPIATFDKNVYTYEVALPAASSSAPVLAAVPSSLNASVQITQARLVSGVGTARAVVRAQNGISTKTYVVNFHEASSNADLSTLTAEGYTITPAFSPDHTDYTVKHSAIDTSAPDVSAMAVSSKAIVTITPATTSIGTTTILVTAENQAQKTYSVKFEQDSRGLSALVAYRKARWGTPVVPFTPNFNPANTAYGYMLNYDQDQQFCIRPTAYAGSITVNDEPINSGNTSEWFAKPEHLEIKVKENGKAEITYTIN